MEQSLREKLLFEIEKMEERGVQLKRHMKEYVDINQFDSANVCKIKYEQLKLVIQQLEKILQKSQQ